MDDQLPGGMFKKAHCLTRPAQARQDVPFHGQGPVWLTASRRMRDRCGEVQGVGEGERREERQACEREADKGPTCLSKL